MTKNKLITLNLICLLIGTLIGGLIWGKVDIRRIKVIEEITICERLGGEYSIHKNFYSKKYNEYCEIVGKQLYTNKINHE